MSDLRKKLPPRPRFRALRVCGVGLSGMSAEAGRQSVASPRSASLPLAHGV